MSAVIYAAIVVMWAVVLVPMWLRRHDERDQSRSVDRFSTAMRTLSRRTPSAPGRRYVVMPKREDVRMSVHVSGAAAVKAARKASAVARTRTASAAASASSAASAASSATQAAAARRRSRSRSRSSLIARRRRAMLAMLAVTFLTLLLAAVGVVSWPLQVVVDVVLIAFCVHLRAQARRAAAVSRQRRRVTVAPGAARPAPAVPAAARVASATAAAAAAAPAAATGAPVWAEQPAAAVIDEPVEAVAAATGTDDALAPTQTWEPVPVPRPTYTMKPAADAYYRDDVTYAPAVETGTSAHPDEGYGADVIGAGDAGDAVADSDLDEILERRWAVND